MMGVYEPAKNFSDMQGVFRKRHESVFIAFGVTNMHPHMIGINISDFKFDAFSKPQPQAVDGEEKDFIALNE